MKSKTAVGLLFSLILTQSCWLTSDDMDGPNLNNPPQDFYKPIIMQRDDFETTTSFQTAPMPMMNTGKIYVKGNYIYK